MWSDYLNRYGWDAAAAATLNSTITSAFNITTPITTSITATTTSTKVLKSTSTKKHFHHRFTRVHFNLILT